MATGTNCPASTLGAPQTIVNISFLISTVVTRNLSALGCLSTVKTLPTTTPAKLVDWSLQPSTSTVCIVKRKAKSSGVMPLGIFIKSFNQLSDNNIYIQS